MINDKQSLVSACYTSGHSIPVYDDGFGPLWISRNSLGINGIVRAQTWEYAYSICEDEFFPEATETVDELVKTFGYKRDHVKIIRSGVSIPESERPSYLGAFEKVAELSDYSDNGRLPDGLFLRSETVETPNLDAWTENELFCEAYGFRPSGPSSTDKFNHGIYEKDLNGDSLDPLTAELCESIGIQLTITDDE